MTVKKNGFDAGTLGGSVATDSGAGAGVDTFNSVSITAGGSLTYDNTHTAHGTQSIKSIPASGGSTTLIWSGLSSTAMAAQMYIYLTALPTADMYLMRFTVAGVRKASMHINAAGKLRLSDSTGTTGLTGWTGGGTAAQSTIPLNGWIRVSMFAQSTATNATFIGAYYSADSTSAIDSISVSTANGGGTAFDAVTFCKTDSSTYVTAHWYDCIQLDDAASGLLGPWVDPASSPVRPISLVSNAGTFTNDGGAADIPSALADELDTTMATSPVNPAAAVMEVKLGSLSAGGNVTVTARHKATAGSPITRTYSLVQGTTIIKSQSVVLPTTATDWSMTTTSGETATITDRSDLRVRISDTV